MAPATPTDEADPEMCELREALDEIRVFLDDPDALLARVFFLLRKGERVGLAALALTADWRRAASAAALAYMAFDAFDPLPQMTAAWLAGHGYHTLAAVALLFP
jgi:hypothetical protein